MLGLERPRGPRTSGLLQRRQVRIEAGRITYLGKQAGELLGMPREVAEDLVAGNTV